ncbi:Uncharacterised protein [Achromobacter sp. 2789STDY5608628]|nr:Uncharacterised protein [Achromobacter sp. 2789STDY5608628]
MVDLALRHRHLLARQAGERAILARGRVAQDGERGLDRVRQVAGLRAGALHDVRVHRQHAVEVVHQRLDLAGKAAVDVQAVAALLRRQLAPQPSQRPQSDRHLHHRRRHQAGGQRPQRQQQHVVEALDRLGQHRAVGRHDQAQRDGVGVLGLEQARQRAQAMVLRAGDVVDAVGAVGRGQGQHLVPQRARARHAGGRHAAVVVEAVDLPVQARQRQLQARVAQGRSHRRPPVRRHADRRRQLVHVQRQFGPQLFGDVLTEQAGQAPAGQHDGDRDPGQRARQQAPAQRAGRARRRHAGQASR